MNKSAFFKMLQRCKELELKNMSVNNFPSSCKVAESSAIKVVSLDSCSINCLPSGSKPALTHFYSYNNSGRVRVQDWFCTSIMEECQVTTKRDITRKRKQDQVNEIRDSILKSMQ